MNMMKADNSTSMRDKAERCPSNSMRIQISIPKKKSQESLPPAGTTTTTTATTTATTTPRNTSKLQVHTGTGTTSTSAPSTTSAVTSAAESVPVMARTASTASTASSATSAVSSSSTNTTTTSSDSSNNLPPAVSPTPRKSGAPIAFQTATETSVAAVAATPCPKDLPNDSGSSSALPPLSNHLWQGLKKKNLKFSINDECTALKLAPSGRLLIGSFSDGTVRLFDLTGTYSNGKKKHKNKNHAGDQISSSSHTKENNPLSQQQQTTETQPPETQFQTQTAGHSEQRSQHNSRQSQQLVCSKDFQRFGAVACQIHAKGVHTNLLMDLDVSEDGLWCFAGVLRGSMEMVAVHLGHLEASFQNTNKNNATEGDSGTKTTSNLLDHVTVFRHSDAKLRGFGACTRLQNHQQHTAANPKYLLFTGKAIKNIHIWSFTPPALHANNNMSNAEPVWQCLYDTQTNGNTIKMLQFRYNGAGDLFGVSKSNDQKLRVWDLSHEQKIKTDENDNSNNNSNGTTTNKKRPNRPPFQDVTHTESTLGVAGGFCLNGGSELYNQMSIVSLDVENLQSLYNHTELALPSSSSASDLGAVSTSGMGSRRRQQRGDLKSIVSVAGMVLDAGQVLLELSDGSILQYTTPVATTNTNSATPESSAAVSGAGLPKLTVWKEAGPLDDSVNRKLCVGRIGPGGVAVAALAMFDPSRGRGRIVLRALDPLPSMETTMTTTTTPASSSNNTLLRSESGGLPTLPNPVATPLKAAMQSVPETQALTEAIHPITTAKKPSKDTNNSSNSNKSLPLQSVAESAYKRPLQAMAEPIHPITTAKKLNKDKNNSSNSNKSLLLQEIVETAKKRPLQSLTETVHPITTAKKPNKDKSSNSNNKSLLLQEIVETAKKRPLQSLTETIHPITTAKKPNKGKNSQALILQAVLETAKKAPLQAQTTRQPLVTPKAVAHDSSSTSTQQLTLPLARRLATTTPLRLPRVSLDDCFTDTVDEQPSPMIAAAAATTSEATDAADDVTEKRPAAKYLRNTHGVKKSTLAAKPTEATKRKPLQKQGSKKDIAAALKPVLPQHPKERSPPVPRKQTEGSDTKEPAEALVDLAAALCTLSASPMAAVPPPRQVTNMTVHRVTAKASVAAKSPLRSHVRKDGEAAKTRIIQECMAQQTTILALLDEIPKSNVASRVNLSSVVTQNLEEVHVLARGKLAAQHRAGHEMMQKRVLRSALGIVQSLKRSPSVGAVGESKVCLERMIQSYKEIVEELIFRQQMEASTLAGQQTCERQGDPAPVLVVSFAFPCVFQQALDCTPQLN